MIYLPYWQELVKLICVQVDQEACLCPCSTKVAGLRPRSTPDSFVVPQKSQQKRAPDLLACHRLRQRQVPFIQQRIWGAEKTRLTPQTFSALIPNQLFHFGCVTRDRVIQKHSPTLNMFEYAQQCTCSRKTISFEINCSVSAKFPVSSSKLHADRVPDSRNSGYTGRNRYVVDCFQFSSLRVGSG